MVEAGVYLGSWDVDSEGILFVLVKDLKALVRRASRAGHCLVVGDDA